MTVAKIPGDLPLAVAQGSDLVVALTVTEGVTPFDFTGVTITTIIYQSDGDVSAQNFATSTAGNVLTLTLSNATTTALGAGSFRYELRATEAGVVSPWVAGNLKVVNRGYGGSSSASASLSITTAPTVSLTISGGVQGVQGIPGVVAATAPITYDSGTQTVGIDTSGLVPTSRQISTSGTGLSGGGDLTADRTITLDPTALAGDVAFTGKYAELINTDGDPGRRIFVGSVDPVVGYTPATGDVWIEVP